MTTVGATDLARYRALRLCGADELISLGRQISLAVVPERTELRLDLHDLDVKVQALEIGRELLNNWRPTRRRTEIEQPRMIGKPRVPALEALSLRPCPFERCHISPGAVGGIRTHNPRGAVGFEPTLYSSSMHYRVHD